jgi:hypothetical protein
MVALSCRVHENAPVAHVSRECKSMNKSRKTAKAKLAKADVKHGAVAVVSQQPLVTAAQIEKDCPAEIEELGNLIAAEYDKLVKCEAKAEQHRDAIGQLLTQAKEACDESGFEAFRERFFPHLGRTRTYELLQIASGKKTIGDIRAATARRMKKHRAAKKTAVEQKPKPSVTVTDPDPQAIPGKRNSDLLKADRKKLGAEPIVESGGAEPTSSKTNAASGNGNALPVGVTGSGVLGEMLKAYLEKQERLSRPIPPEATVAETCLVERWPLKQARKIAKGNGSVEDDGFFIICEFVDHSTVLYEKDTGNIFNIKLTYDVVGDELVAPRMDDVWALRN